MSGKGRIAVLAGILALGGAASAPDVAAQVKSSSDKVSVQLYGQVNRGLLWADDGDESTLYFVDNSNSSTRIGVNAKAKVDGGMTVGGKVEVEIASNASNSSAGINQTVERVSPVTFNERHLDFYLEGDFGKLSLGQGDTASNGTSEVDLSGTTVVGYSDMEMLAGGLIFFDKANGSLYENPTEVDPALLKMNPKVRDAFDNFDGLSRDDRVRYDSPKLGGFQASASAIAQKAWDGALRYAGEFAGTKVEAAVAWADPGDQNKLMDGQVNGSVSVLFPMGLSVTAAAGQQSLDDPKRTEDPAFWYGKLGYTAKLLFAGSTTLAVDYGVTNNLKKDNDEAQTYGAFLVQRLDSYNAELYAGYRIYQLDRMGKDYQDVAALMTGARIRF